MTEGDWLICAVPHEMLKFLQVKASDRKLRLFAVGCSRRFSRLIHDQRVDEALDVAERLADGLAGDLERSNARKAAQQAAQVRGIVTRPEAPKWERRVASLAYYATARRAVEAAWNVPDLAVEVLVWRAGGYGICDWQAIKTEEQTIQSDLFRDLIGNPYRSIALDSAWLTPKVKALASAIYDGRVFDRMPELAAALQEAGCQDADTLIHCRQPGPHLRSCWVVDLLLGKA